MNVLGIIAEYNQNAIRQNTEMFCLFCLIDFFHTTLLPYFFPILFSFPCANRTILDRCRQKAITVITAATP